MPWNLLLFPLLGGFLFLHCNLFKYRSRRFEGERLLLHSASYGIVFGALGRLVTFEVSRFEAGARLQAFLEHLVTSKDAPYLGTAIAAWLLGWVSAYVINRAIALLDNRLIKLWIVSRYDDALLRMLYLAMYENRPVSLTLSHRKVYIGYVFDPPGDSPHDRYLTLMLLLSGYRKQDTLRFVQTVNYTDRTVLGRTEEESRIFTMTLPIDAVVSANVFDLAVYEQEFAERLIL